MNMLSHLITDTNQISVIWQLAAHNIISCVMLILLKQTCRLLLVKLFPLRALALQRRQRILDPHYLKARCSSSVDELARCLSVHKNSVRHWQRKGLMPIDDARPALFQGAVVRAL